MDPNQGSLEVLVWQKDVVVVKVCNLNFKSNLILNVFCRPRFFLFPQIPLPIKYLSMDLNHRNQPHKEIIYVSMRKISEPSSENTKN